MRRTPPRSGVLLTALPVEREYIAVDWSGAAGRHVPGIWVAVVRDGCVCTLLQPGSRAAAGEWLLRRVARALPCVIGLDFSFGFPAWWCASNGWTSAAQGWRAADADGEAWLAACDPPFWGRRGRPRPHEHARGLRVTDASRQVQAKSVFQIGGAGSVGTGSLRGMPLLLALRAAGAAIWPMDAPAQHTVIEVYPRILAPVGVVKRDRAAREGVLAAYGDEILPRAMRAEALASEDAFDAVLSALTMSRHRVETTLDEAQRDTVSRVEGRVWVPPLSDEARAR